MSLIVNGTTVKKVIVVKDSVSTNLKKLIVNGVTVFSALLPPPIEIKSFNQDLRGDIVSYGDIGDNTYNPYDGITEGIAACSAILLTKYVANNGHPYQTMRRAYIGNTEEGLPNFMADDGYLEIMSTLGGFKHLYLPVDYYGTTNPLPTVNGGEILGIIPIMSSALSNIGASPTHDYLLPHDGDFGGRVAELLLPAETGTYSNGNINIFVFAETAEMKEFRDAHPELGTVEPFISAPSVEIHTSYLLFQPYDKTETIEDVISYYFGEDFENLVVGNSRYGDVETFYETSGLSNVSGANIIVMDSINSWADYFNEKGIDWNTGNPFYDCANAVIEGGAYGYLGPWASPAAQWPETDNNAQPALLMDKIPRGFDIGIYQNMPYPVLFGPQALAEALIMDLIPSNKISIKASANIDNLKEVYEAFETDPIDSGISGIPLVVDLYNVLGGIPYDGFIVGTKTI